ncbi:MAG: peptidylprolyl isomerase [Candidatus Eisenbacteria bacterium]
MLRKAVRIVLVTGIFCALLLSCGQKQESVVARVGDKEITLGDFNIAHKTISVFSRPPLVTYEDCEAFLNTMINKELIVQEAVARGLDKNEDLVKDAERWEMELVIGALYKDVSEANLEVTAEEVEDYYKLSRVTVKARQILVETAEKAEEIAKKLEAGDDFAKLAASFSIDERSAASGGDLGEVRHGQVDPLIERVVFSLSPGQVSDPVKGTRGYHLVEVLERAEPSMDDFENERAVCAAELRSRKRNEAWNSYLTNVKMSLGFEFNDENVHWLNGLLPERGSVDRKWVEGVADEDRGRLLVKSIEGEWTVGDFVDYVATAGGLQPFNTEDGSLVRSVAEAVFINKRNLAEGKKRGLEKTDTVVRGIERKKEERLVDLFFSELTREASVPEERIREEYENRKDELVTPDRVRLVLINLAEEGVAEEVRRKAVAGASMEDLAREHNRGRLKEKGGVTELLTRESLPGELQRYAFDVLKVGEISPVVRAPLSGAHFVCKLIEKDPEHPTTFEEAKMTLGEPLLQEERDRLLDEWLTEEREKRGVTVYPETLNQLLEIDEAEAVVPGGGAVE